MGFDTPETGYAKCDAERRLGLAAGARLAQLILLAKKVEPRTDGRLDRYGRTLGRLFLDGRDVGKVLIAEGYAAPYHGRGRRPDWCARLRPG